MNKLIPLAAAGAGVMVASRILRRRHIWDFHGRSVVVTGGSRGLGLAIARRFAAEGAKLTIFARDRDEVERAAVDLRGRGAEVEAFTADVTDEADARRAIDRAVERFGRIDVLINNAGIIAVGPEQHQEREDWERSLAVHVWGPLFTMRAAAEHMRRQGEGRIANISSIGGKISVPHLLPYSTGKFALIGLSDGMRAELAKDNIQITTVAPGLMRTGSPPNAEFKGQQEKEYAWFTISDANPLVSISADRAAEQVVDAVRYGAPALTISFQARLLELANTVFPGLTAAATSLGARLLPASTGPRGDEAKTGWESQSAIAPSPLTALSDDASAELNQGGRPE